jgi:hypothetical protein
MTCTGAERQGWTAFAAVLLGLAVGGCSAGRTGSATKPVFVHQAEYKVSCSVSDECRVQYLDQSGVLRGQDIVGEWSYALGINPGGRMWVRASGGGCPPRPVRVEIWLDGRTVAERLERPGHRSRCDWILSETEFVVP